MPRATPEARARLEEVRRTQILEAAARVFAEKGYDGATVTEIAHAAGLSEGSIYNYFQSKEHLLINIPGQLVEPVLVPLADRPPLPADLAGVERALVEVASAAVERVRRHAGFLKVFLSALPYLSPEAREAYVRLLPTHVAEILEQFLRAGMRTGLFRRDLNPAIAARTLPGMLLVFLMLQEVLLERKLTPFDYDDVVSEAVEIFLYGAAGRSSRRRPAARRSPRRVR